MRSMQREWVVQNAAMILYAAGMAPSISAGVPMAQHILETGAAAAKLSELAKPTPRADHKESAA